MDELQQRRERQDREKSRGESPVVKLAARDREAERQDQVAEGRDEAATVADRDADDRDRVAELRDAGAEDATSATTPGSAVDRRREMRAREDAAYDREQAVADRGRARRDRKVSKKGRVRASGDRGAAWEALAEVQLMLSDAEDDAEDMLLIGRAQGIIMKERGLPPTEALLELCAQSARNGTNLAGAALHIVEDPSTESVPAPHDAVAEAPGSQDDDVQGIARRTIAAVEASEGDDPAEDARPPRDA